MAQTSPRGVIVLFRGKVFGFGPFISSIAVLTVIMTFAAALSRSLTVVQTLGFGVPVILAVAGLTSGQLTVHDVSTASWPKALRVALYIVLGMFFLLLLAIFFYPLLIPWVQRPDDACLCLDAARLTNTLVLSSGLAALIVIQTLFLTGIAGCCWNVIRILRQ